MFQPGLIEMLQLLGKRVNGKMCGWEDGMMCKYINITHLPIHSFAHILLI